MCRRREEKGELTWEMEALLLQLLSSLHFQLNLMSQSVIKHSTPTVLPCFLLKCSDTYMNKHFVEM